MSYKLDFFDSFSCSGSACQNTCCCGWDIALDKDTYDFYEHAHGAFSKYVKKNIGKNEENYFIRMTEQRVCPFLDGERLCNIYKEYGPEHMGNTCQHFPRAYRKIEGKTTFSMLNHSCEEVLNNIFEHNGPIYLVEEGEETSFPFEIELAEFMSLCMDVLQQSDISLGLGLGTILYFCVDEFSDKEKREKTFAVPTDEMVLNLLQEFALVPQSTPKEDLEYSAWETIFCVVETFCHTLSRSNLRAKDRILWNEAVYGLSEEKRKKYIRLVWEKNKDKSADEQEKKRRLYASYIAKSFYLCNDENFSQILLGNVCNYIILSEILPCIWKEEKKGDYFPLMAELGRVFEHTKVMVQHVNPAIQKAIHPDVLTYALTFMVLF